MWFGVGTFGLGLYFLPTIVAYVRGARNAGSVLLINALLGWTLILWIVALVMAVRTVPPPGVTPVYFVSPPPPPRMPSTRSAQPFGDRRAADSHLPYPADTSPSWAASPTMSVGPPPGWAADPAGRFQLRYWDGVRWTEFVTTNGVPDVDHLYT